MCDAGEDRRWMLVMLSGLQQPDDRSSQSVGSSSYSADSREREGVLWSLVQTGAGKMVRGQAGNTGVTQDDISGDPSLTLGHCCHQGFYMRLKYLGDECQCG